MCVWGGGRGILGLGLRRVQLKLGGSAYLAKNNAGCEPGEGGPKLIGQQAPRAQCAPPTARACSTSPPAPVPPAAPPRPSRPARWQLPTRGPRAPAASAAPGPCRPRPAGVEARAAHACFTGWLIRGWHAPAASAAPGPCRPRPAGVGEVSGGGGQVACVCFVHVCGGTEADVWHDQMRSPAQPST